MSERTSEPSPRGDGETPTPAPAPTAETAAASSPDLVPVVGANLRRLRTRKGLSLERLAKLSGVSRAMLGQIELAQSAPTINVVWRIASALGVPFGALLTAGAASGAQVMRATGAKILTSHDGSFTSRALFPFDAPRRTEFYELRLHPHGIEHADPHAPGTTENLVVSAGSVVVGIGAERHVLATGDAILFAADVPHTYENPHDDEAIVYLVMTYAIEVGG